MRIIHCVKERKERLACQRGWGQHISMAKVKNNFQDTFLQQMKRERIGVVVYLVNGFQLKGTVKGFDNFTLFLENEGKIQMVYKHSITTISPVKPVKFNFQPAEQDTSSQEPSDSEE